MLVYLADDSLTVRIGVRALLMRHGHVVRAFACGEGLIGARKIVIPDIVVTDLAMEPIDGFAVIRAMVGVIPVIAMSGSAHQIALAELQGAIAGALKTPEGIASLPGLVAKFGDLSGSGGVL